MIGTQPTGATRFRAAASPPARNPDRMLGLREVLDITKHGKTSLYASIKAGTFPAPYRISVRRVAWKASEVQGYIDSLLRAAAKPGGTP